MAVRTRKRRTSKSWNIFLTSSLPRALAPCPRQLTELWRSCLLHECSTAGSELRGSGLLLPAVTQNIPIQAYVVLRWLWGGISSFNSV